MERKESKFNPEFSFLEHKDILALQILVDEILRTEPDKKEPLLDRLSSDWDKVQNECIKEAEQDDSKLKDFIRFVRSNVNRMDTGGLNVGRSRIGILIEGKAKELRPYFEKFPEDLE